MADERDGFLRRWSQRKREAREGEPRTAEQPEPADATPPEVPAQAADAPAPEALPDIDSLDDSSDFTVFLKEGVPEALRRKALRKLWRVNPVLANLDGLNDYDEDYTQVGKTAMAGLRTAYRVGRGMIKDGELEEAEASAQEPVSGAAQGHEPQPDHHKNVSVEENVSVEAAGGAEPHARGPGEPSNVPARAAESAPEPAPPAAKNDPPTQASGARGSARRRRWGGFES